jgi:hypothetical protein
LQIEYLLKSLCSDFFKICTRINTDIHRVFNDRMTQFFKYPDKFLLSISGAFNDDKCKTKTDGSK